MHREPGARVDPLIQIKPEAFAACHIEAMSAHALVIQAIEQEHRVLGHVVDVLQHTLRDIAAGHTEPDSRLLAAILYYIEDFPERFHHPKEERHLFEPLRARTRELDPVLDELEHEHVRSGEMVRGLHAALVHYIAGAHGALQALMERADAYAAMLREHMRKEEALLARADLAESEWQAILAAFAANEDPLLAPNVRAELRNLYRRIQMLLPSKMRHPADR